MSRKVKKKVPELRFPEFEGDWIFVKLHDIALIQTGVAKGENKEFKNPVTMPYIRVANVQEGYLDLNIVKEITIEKEKYERYLLKYNDLLLTEGGDFDKLGRGAIWKNQIHNCLHQNHIFVVRPYIKKLISEYLESVVNSFYGKKYFQLASKQTTNLATINSTQLKDFPVPLPSIAEQEKIASFLGAVDTRLNQLRRKRELLQTYKRGVMQKIFSQKIRFKDAFGSSFPDWKKKKLGELTFKVGKKNKENVLYPIYSINNQRGFVPQSEQFEGVDSNERGYDTSLYKIIQKNTFAYNPARINVGSIGYSGELENIIISSLYVCFKTKQELYDFYLLQYLETFDFNKSVLRNVEGGVREYLFYENFSNIKIPLPSLEEQEKITNFLTTIDHKIETLSRQIDQTEKFKKGLLQKLFI